MDHSLIRLCNGILQHVVCHSQTLYLIGGRGGGGRKESSERYLSHWRLVHERFSTGKKKDVIFLSCSAGLKSIVF